MKNMYGETVKPQYEVALKQHVKGDVDNDYETVDFIGADNYKEACKIAKAQSKGIGKNNDRFHETERKSECWSCHGVYSLLLFRRCIGLQRGLARRLCRR